MFKALGENIKKTNELLSTSINNITNENIERNNSFFSFFYYRRDDLFYYNYYFSDKQIKLNRNKQKISVVVNEKTPKYYNKNKFLYKNQVVGVDITKEISSTDIVSGLPKLNSLLENSYEAESTKYSLSSLNLAFTLSRELKINNYDLTINKKEEEQEGLSKNKWKRENKDPEILLWSLFSHYKTKNTLTKSLVYSKMKAKNTVLNSLVKVYKDQNINLRKKIFAGVVNTMFNRVFIAEATFNPFLVNDEIYIKLYIKLVKIIKNLNFIPPVGLPLVEGISKSVTSSPRLLNSISFRDTTNSLINHSLYQPKDWLTSIKSKLILGQRTDIGTSMFKRMSFYNNVNNFIINK